MIIKLNEKTVKIQIFDTGGLEDFQDIRRTYYKGAVVALLVYDITRKETFTHITKWLEEIKSNISEQITIILIGNKKDLEDKREVSYKEGEAFAKKNGFMFFETSAKIPYNIVEVFKNSIQFILNNIIIHSEISNIKLKYENDNDFEIKLTDYGLAKSYQNNSNSKYDSFVGTEFYIAPEVYQNKGCSKSDLWSIGLILYYLYHKKKPIENIQEYINSNKDILIKKTKLEIFDDLINKLLVKDPNKRINWKDYFIHPFNIL